MSHINIVAIVVAALGAFVASGVWYVLFGKRLTRVSPAFAAGRPAAWKMAVVVVQSLVLASVLAFFMSLTGDGGWADGLRTGCLLWIGLPAVQWVGSIVFERVPLEMAAIHAGDWLVKLVLICVILGAWRH